MKTINESEQARLATMKAEAETRLKRYPAFYYDRLALVDTSTARLAIDDISYRAGDPVQEDIEMLQLACRGWLEVYDAQDLTEALAQKMKRLLSALNPRKTIIVFPGNGAQAVKDLLPSSFLDGIATVDLPTRRIINPRTNEIEGIELENKTAMREAISSRKAETIIVVDDVIVTGSTLSALKSVFPMRNLEWYAGALMALSPVQNRRGGNSSGIEGYQSILAPIAYQGTTGIPALNSFSTLVGESEKSQLVRSRYMERYVEDSETFLAAVASLRAALTKI